MSLDAYDLWCSCGGAVRPVGFMYRGGKCERCGMGYLLMYNDDGEVVSAQTSPMIQRLVENAERISTRTLGIERKPGTHINAPRDVSASFDIPLSPELRAFHEHAFGIGTDRQQLIRAEVEAMDWPEVIDG